MCHGGSFLVAKHCRAGTKTKKNSTLEPSAFWSGIAENEHVDKWRRGLAIYMLFDRHLTKDATLGDLASVLHKPKWLKETDVVTVTKGGVISLEPTPGDTMFLIVVFSNEDIEKHNKESIGIYVNVAGKIEKKEFVDALMGHAEKNISNRKIKGTAFFPAWNDYIKQAAP